MKIILYKNIYLKRIIILFLVVLISFNSIFMKTSEASITLAAAWGGTMVAKEVLKFVLLLAGMGITFATSSDAYDLYNQLNNDNNFMSLLLNTEKEILLNRYDTNIENLDTIKNTLYDKLTTIFGNLQYGQNIKEEETIYTNINFTLSDNKKILYVNSYSGRLAEYPLYSGEFTSYKVTNIVSINSYNYRVYLLLNTTDLSNWATYFDVNKSRIEPITTSTAQELSINIDENAIILEPNSINADENNKKKMVPPPYLGPYDIPYKSISGKITEEIEPSGEISKYYDGDIEQYLSDVTNDASWEDIDSYINNPTKSISLYETIDNRLKVVENETNSIPYPEINTNEPTSVLEGLGAINGFFQSLLNLIANIWNLIKDIFSIPDESNKVDLDFTPITNIGITQKFPFSLPWDLADTIGLLVSPPSPPIWEINLLGNKLEIDFSVFDEWAMISRTFFTIIFVAGLIILTKRFLG